MNLLKSVIEKLKEPTLPWAKKFIATEPMAWSGQLRSPILIGKTNLFELGDVDVFAKSGIYVESSVENQYTSASILLKYYLDLSLKLQHQKIVDTYMKELGLSKPETQQIGTCLYTQWKFSVAFVEVSTETIEDGRVESRAVVHGPFNENIQSLPAEIANATKKQLSTSELKLSIPGITNKNGQLDYNQKIFFSAEKWDTTKTLRSIEIFSFNDYVGVINGEFTVLCKKSDIETVSAHPDYNDRPTTDLSFLEIFLKDSTIFFSVWLTPAELKKIQVLIKDKWKMEVVLKDGTIALAF